MALVLQDRVSVNSTGSGTGSLVLGSAYPGYRSFASCIPDGSIVYYAITNQAVGYDTEWEVGYGTYTLSSNTLSRDFVYSSSNAGALVNFTAGTNGLQVFITQPSEQAVFQDPDGTTTFPEGIISVVGANATAPTFATTLSSFVSNVPNYSQLVVQNQSNNANASADVVSYNNLGDGFSYFIDAGINSSTYNSADYPILQANDGYLFTGGNIAGTGAAGDISRLMIGTSTANSNVVIFGGSVNVNAAIATFVASTKQVIFSDGIQVTGNASANNVTLTNLAYAAGNLSNASNSTVLTTKAYVDSAVATGFVVHTPVRAATTANLAANYANGSSGVGATLTADTNRAFSTLDGVTGWSVGQRVLVKNQTSALQNGAYTLTTVGDGSTPWVLTRATDFDTAAAGEIANNAYFYVTSGTANGGSSWVLSQLAAITVGTTSLPFDQFASSLVYSGGQNIDVTGQTISLTGIVPVANGGTNLSSYTTGDVVYANATNTIGKLAIGSTNSVLTSNGTIPGWGTVALGSANAVSGTLGATNGGTGQSTYTTGDILYSSASNTLSKLAGQTTTTQKFLSQTGDGVNSAAPVWDTIPSSSITGLGTMSTQNANAVTITGGSLDNVVIGGATANAATFTTANATTFNGSGSGLTSLNGSNVSSGTIANARTTAATANGASTIVLRDAAGNFAANTITANLSGTASSATSATSATTATNIAGGAAGSIPYQTGSGATALLATASGVLVGGTTPAYSTAPTLTGTNFSAIPNAALSNSAVTINGTSVSLGGSGSVNTNQTVTFNNGGTGNTTGVTFNGGTAITVSYNTIGAAPTAGSTNITSVGTVTAGTWNANSISTTYTDAKVTSATAVAGTGISVTSITTTGAATHTITNTGVTSATAGTGVSVSASTGAVTFSIGQAVATSSNVQFNSLGVGTAGSAVAGEIRATNNVTAYYSDERLKTKIGDIENALDKVKQIETMVYHANETAVALGYDASVIEVGVTAQSVQKVMPQTVAPAPIDENYMTVRYERLVPLLIEAIKDLEKQVTEIKARIK